MWFHFTVPEGDDGGAKASIEVSTCGSEPPASDSLLQVFKVMDTDSGTCEDFGRCRDGSACIVSQGRCDDLSTCDAVEQACSISEQDCANGAVCGTTPIHACERLASIGCNDDAVNGCNDPAQVGNSTVCLGGLDRGETYYIELAVKTDDARGRYSLTVREVGSCLADPTTPSNDFCDTADVASEGVVPFDLTGATVAECRAETCLPGLGNDVWYTYRPPHSGLATIETCADPAMGTLDTELIVYEGCGCGPDLGAPLCCSGSRPPGVCNPEASQCVIPVARGGCYLIQLGDNRSAGAAGELTIALQETTNCPDVEVVWIDPLPGTIDARMPVVGGDPEVLAGIDAITLGGPLNADLECWSICESNGNAALHPVYPDELRVNGIREITDNADGTVTVHLTRPITPGEVSALTYTSDGGARSSLRLGALPGDVAGDGVATAADVLALIDVLNATAEPAWGDLSLDCDHSNAVVAADILCVIDLLNSGWYRVSLEGLAEQCP